MELPGARGRIAFLVFLAGFDHCSAAFEVQARLKRPTSAFCSTKSSPEASCSKPCCKRIGSMDDASGMHGNLVVQMLRIS